MKHKMHRMKQRQGQTAKHYFEKKYEILIMGIIVPFHHICSPFCDVDSGSYESNLFNGFL